MVEFVVLNDHESSDQCEKRYVVESCVGIGALRLLFG